LASTISSPPRTLLEALVRQRHWSQAEFCRAYARTATDELRTAQTVTTQTAGRWFAGQLKGLPYPAQQRVLQAMFGYEAAILLGPPDAIPATAVGRTDGPDDQVQQAATESAQFLMRAERTNVGPHTLDQFAAELRRIVTVYPNRPVYPLFMQLRELRDRAFEILEGRQYPNQARDLYMIAGTTCGVLANASFDLGNLAAAETQARTAFLCAELAGHNGLRAWIRGTQSLIAYWDDRPRAAVDHAVDGSRYIPESGTALVRLAAIEARARARADSGDTTGVEAALRRAEQAREAATPDEPGGMMAFPEAKQAFYAGTARLWLGGKEALALAEADAHRSVVAYEQAPAEDRRLGELNLARLDLATARLRTDMNGTAEQVRAVLDVSAHRPTDSVARRLRQVAAALNQRPYESSRLAADLRHEIAARVDHAAVPALGAGT
jgi:hypothetical protein